MKRAFLATLGLAVVVLAGFGLLGTAGVASAANTHVITIASPQANTAVAGGNTFTFTLAITQSDPPPANGYKAIQWEVAYSDNVSFVSATYNCTDPSGINFPAETDTAPVEGPLIPGVKNLGGGSNCASLRGSFHGTNALGTFVTVVLHCDSVLNSQGMAGDAVVIRPATDAANPANDPLFGTTLLDEFAAAIPTDDAPVSVLPGFGPQANVQFACAAPVDYSVQKTPPTQNASGDAPNNVANQTISIANPDNAAHAVFLNDTVPAGLTVTNVVPSAGANCTVGPAPAAAGPGPTPPYYGPGPYPAAPAGHIICVGAAPGGGSMSAVVTTTASPAADCSTAVNTVSGGPADATTADGNLANNGAGAQIVVDCPNISVTKTCVDDNGPPAFTDDTFTCTITTSNDGPATGSTAHNVVLSNALSGGMSFVSASPPCAGGFPCALGDIPAGGSVVVTVHEKAPSTAATACDTASATQNAPGPASNSVQVCQDVKNKFPQINGFAKDTGVTPTNPDGSLNTNFTFTFGNLFLCKPLGSANPNLPPPGAFSGAGESACGVFKIAEIVQEPDDIDTCQDDNDKDGKGCAGIPGPLYPFQDPSDGCRLNASDYIPGVTKVDCDGGEVPEGLGAAEFQVKFDDKIFQSPTFDCTVTPTDSPAILGSTGRPVMLQVSVITENWVQFGCVTKDPANDGNPATNCPPANTLPDGTCPGPSIANASVLGTLTLTVQNDLLSRMRPAKENGVVSNLLDENCEKADTLGQPFNEGLDANGFLKAPSGGLSQDCKDAALTVRMLEGDINLDCKVDIADDQSEAFRYGQFFGQLAYNRFFDLEPPISPDFDIDIKDLQTVFGRNGSTCAAPIPAQNPNPTTPDP